MGTIIIPMKKGVKPRAVVAVSTDPTRNSLIRAIPAMENAIIANALRVLQ
jgi:hypothetical protein